MFHLATDQMINAGKTKPRRCADCDEAIPGGARAFARHLYAHTFVKRAAADLAQICSDCEAELDCRAAAERHLADAGNGCRNAPKAVYPCVICRGREGRGYMDCLECHLSKYLSNEM